MLRRWILAKLFKRQGEKCPYDLGYGVLMCIAFESSPAQVGEGFIRELDFSRIWIRINEDADGDRDDIIAEFRGDTKDFLEQCIVSGSS